MQPTDWVSRHRRPNHFLWLSFAPQSLVRCKLASRDEPNSFSFWFIWHSMSRVSVCSIWFFKCSWLTESPILHDLRGCRLRDLSKNLVRIIQFVRRCGYVVKYGKPILDFITEAVNLMTASDLLMISFGVPFTTQRHFSERPGKPIR